MESEYCWCLHCERALRRAEAEKRKGCPMCGAGMMDIWSWEEIRKLGYPEIPVVGEYYPQYPSEA